MLWWIVNYGREWGHYRELTIDSWQLTEEKHAVKVGFEQGVL
jgi:hypothetical protein